jgi:hypothetical protein
MSLLANWGRAAAVVGTLGTLAAPRLAVAETPVVPPVTTPAVAPLYLATSAAPTATATATDTVTASFQVTDVALDAEGMLNGQALSPQGQPLANQVVVLDDGVAQRSVTAGADGRFRFDGVRGGAYRVSVANQTQFCRAWRYGTAPPAATGGLMVVQGGPTVLGQYCGSPVGCGTPVSGGFFGGGGGGGFRNAMRNPLVVGGVVAAAIAVPVAIANSDDDDDAPAS